MLSQSLFSLRKVSIANIAHSKIQKWKPSNSFIKTKNEYKKYSKFEIFDNLKSQGYYFTAS